MTTDFYREILIGNGFAQIGTIEYQGFRMTFWWNSQLRLEVSLVHHPASIALRATKHYRMVAMGEGGESHTRDLEAFNAYLRGLFEEIHITLSSFRDITRGLARKRIKEKGFRGVPAEDESSAVPFAQRYDELTARFEETRDEVRRYEDMLRLDHGKSALLQRHLREQTRRGRQQLEEIRAEAKTMRDQSASQEKLEKAYLRSADATCLIFSCCSNIQVVDRPADFADALACVVKELRDVHRYQIKQKLGSKLQVYVEETDAPAVSLFTRWAGAALCPRQLEHAGLEFASLRETVEDEFMVFPWEDVVIGGVMKDQRKLVGSRTVRNFLQALARVRTTPGQQQASPEGKMPVWIGDLGDHDRAGSPWHLPLDKMVHMHISGTTGSGKSYLARAIVEGSTAYSSLSIVILDPRGQWTGLLSPEDRPGILARYNRFDLPHDSACAFDFTYHSVAEGVGERLPDDLRQLARGRHIVSFRGADARTTCRLSADVLDALFEARSGTESALPRLLIVIEEAQLFTKKGVGSEARAAAGRTELSIERIAREGRKYGMNLMFISQTIRDFSHAVAAVRQNICTRVFMRNTDNEIEYAADFLQDSKELPHLKPGEAIVWNPDWGSAKVTIRPPLSKVLELSPEETQRLVQRGSRTRRAVSPDANKLLAIIREHYRDTGNGLSVSEAARRLGIKTGRKMQRLVDELENARLVRSQRLRERGQPRILVPILSDPVDETPD